MQRPFVLEGGGTSNVASYMPGTHLGQAQAYLACVIERCISALQPVTVHCGGVGLPVRSLLIDELCRRGRSWSECLRWKYEDNTLWSKTRQVTNCPRSYIR